MITLENEFLKVSVRNKGAELTSVYSKMYHIEHLWQADPGVWAWHAPNLFPVIGECIRKNILVNGKAYKMERHGFARNSSFALQESSASLAMYTLQTNDNTMGLYPYQFEFQIHYQLIGSQLKVTYRVINKDDKMLYFSVGAHPAFNVPFGAGENYNDYYLEFAADQILWRHMISEAGLFNGQMEPVVLDEQKLNLTKKLFEKDALVFKDLTSRQVSLKSRKHPHSVTVEFAAFNYLGIWAKPGADFVCIEPWLGCADTEGVEVDIQDKEAIQSLDAGKTFEAAFSIAIS